MGVQIISDAFNKIESEVDKDTANAFREIAIEIEKSNNADAVENFNAFSEELQKQEPKNSLLSSLWNGVTRALPSILEMTEAVAKIVALF